MDLIRWRNGLDESFRDFEGLQEEINRLFDDLTRPPEPRGIFERTFSPAVDVIENADGYEVLCDMPGIEIEDIEISVAGAVLTLKGEKKAGPAAGDPATYREEVRAGRFQRTLRLPLPVEADKVEATLRDGVLRIALPKIAEVKPRQVAVKVK
jgi:HSP20 family protein